jgi:chromo domain-containing protein 1
MQGFIPGKYRKPPLTCPYWLNGLAGCKKSADECQFAHKNTGWIKHSDPAMGDVRIDSNQRPKYDDTKSLRPDQRPKQDGTTSLRPDQLTCYYWSKGKCRKSEQDCAYQHKDTGIIADGPYVAHQRSSPIPEVQDNMEIDDANQPHLTDIVAPAPSPMLFEQPQQFEFQPPPPPPPPPPPIKHGVKITCEQLQASGGSVCTLEFEDMFASNDGEEAVNLVQSRAFLMYHPEDHFEDLEVITRWLLLHHVQVASASYQGAWAVFKQQILQGGSGIIIVCNSHFVKPTTANHARHIRTLSTSRRFQVSAIFFVRTCVFGRSDSNQVLNTTLL